MMSNSLASTRPAPLVSIMLHASQTPSSSSPLHGSKPERSRHSTASGLSPQTATARRG